MAVAASSLEFRYSGGSANAAANSCLGGAISTAGQVVDAVKNSLFDDVTSAEAASGDVEYRGIYVKNADATQTVTNVTAYISQLTSSASDELDIGLAVEATGVTMATIADEQTAPTSVVFSRPTTDGAGLAIGTLTAGQAKGLWVRRTVSASAVSGSVTAQLAVGFDTV